VDSCLLEREKWQLSRFSKCPSWTFWKPQHRSLQPVSITPLFSKWMAGYPGFWVNCSPKGHLIHPSTRMLMGCWSWMLTQLLKHQSYYDQYRIQIVAK
jgi:hypothetical protein